jgi:hypothetical protein
MPPACTYASTSPRTTALTSYPADPSGTSSPRGARATRSACGTVGDGSVVRTADRLPT